MAALLPWRGGESGKPNGDGGGRVREGVRGEGKGGWRGRGKGVCVEPLHQTKHILGDAILLDK